MLGCSHKVSQEVPNWVEPQVPMAVTHPLVHFSIGFSPFHILLSHFLTPVSWDNLPNKIPGSQLLSQGLL